MRIRKLVLKNFGKFSDKSIELYDGINILYGENEAGKSTIHAFIKGMLFGMERGRGRAAANDTYSTYEPWVNPNYYAGSLSFVSGGKNFRIDRNFDRYSRKAELICEDDGEELSVADGDLDVLMGGITADNYDNTVSVGQLKAETGQPLAADLKNYATNYYAAGNEEIDLEGALEYLKEKKKSLERELKAAVGKKQQVRERTEQEISYVWRDIQHLEKEKMRIEEAFRHRKAKKKEQNEELPNVLDEIRPRKWRIHPVEIILFLALVILAFALIARPWNYMVSIVIFLACGLYVWNRMKVGKKQEKTPSELMLEEITPEEEKISLEKLEWEKEHISEELQEKQIQYNNLKEQLEELDEISSECLAYERKKTAVQMAADRILELSGEFQGQLRDRLDGEASAVLSQITGGKYTKLLIEEGLHMSLLKDGQRIAMEQVSRGTLEQIYFALRMTADGLLHEEEIPIILDDSFAYYDDERLKNTLKWLLEHKRQIILFTCHRREEAVLRELGVKFHKEIIG